MAQNEPEESIRHNNGKPELLPSKRLLFSNVSFYKLPDWKLYYYFRNRLLKYKLNELRFWKVLCIDSVVDLFKIAYLNKEQVRIAFEALKDGILRKTGIKYKP